MSSPLCDSLIEKGITALRAQRHHEAIGALAEALELAPNDAEALSVYGLALLRAGRAAQAEAPLARALLAACGLDWEEACASFQSTARAVTTLSAIEVRSSVRVRNDAHLRYAPQLAPLREQLQRSGIDLATGAWRDSA